MSCHFNKILPLRSEQVVERTAAPRGQASFGIITEIDAKDTLRNKIGVDFGNYRIFDARGRSLAREFVVTPRALVVAHSVATANNEVERMP